MINTADKTKTSFISLKSRKFGTIILIFIGAQIQFSIKKKKKQSYKAVFGLAVTTSCKNSYNLSPHVLLSKNRRKRIHLLLTKLA